MSKHEAQALRAALKEKGWNARKVSVRSEPVTYSSKLVVTVRDPSVRLCEVKKVADAFRSVRYCEYTGETLLGGNTYVDVRYAHDVLDAVEERLLAQYEPKPQGFASVVEGVAVMKMEDREWLVWPHKEGDPNAAARCYNVNYALTAAAGMVLDQGYEYGGSWYSLTA